MFLGKSDPNSGDKNYSIPSSEEVFAQAKNGCSYSKGEFKTLKYRFRKPTTTECVKASLTQLGCLFDSSGKVIKVDQKLIANWRTDPNFKYDNKENLKKIFSDIFILSKDQGSVELLSNVGLQISRMKSNIEKSMASSDNKWEIADDKEIKKAKPKNLKAKNLDELKADLQELGDNINEQLSIEDEARSDLFNVDILLSTEDYKNRKQEIKKIYEERIKAHKNDHGDLNKLLKDYGKFLLVIEKKFTDLCAELEKKSKLLIKDEKIKLQNELNADLKEFEKQKIIELEAQKAIRKEHDILKTEIPRVGAFMSNNHRAIRQFKKMDIMDKMGITFALDIFTNVPSSKVKLTTEELHKYIYDSMKGESKIPHFNPYGQTVLNQLFLFDDADWDELKFEFDGSVFKGLELKERIIKDLFSICSDGADESISREVFRTNGTKVLPYLPEETLLQVLKKASDEGTNLDATRIKNLKSQDFDKLMLDCFEKLEAKGDAKTAQYVAKQMSSRAYESLIAESLESLMENIENENIEIAKFEVKFMPRKQELILLVNKIKQELDKALLNKKDFNFASYKKALQIALILSGEPTTRKALDEQLHDFYRKAYAKFPKQAELAYNKIFDKTSFPKLEIKLKIEPKTVAAEEIVKHTSTINQIFVKTTPPKTKIEAEQKLFKREEARFIEQSEEDMEKKEILNEKTEPKKRTYRKSPVIKNTIPEK